jgi:hypothetical protein
VCQRWKSLVSQGACSRFHQGRQDFKDVSIFFARLHLISSNSQNVRRTGLSPYFGRAFNCLDLPRTLALEASTS